MAERAMQQSVDMPDGARRQWPPVLTAFAQQLGIQLVQVHWLQPLNASAAREICGLM